MNDITVGQIFFAISFSLLFVIATTKLGIADPIFDFIDKFFDI